MRKIYNAPFNLKTQSSGEIECVFATTEVWDHDNDFTVKGAFGSQDNIILEPWNHNYMALPVGRGRIYEKGNDAIFQGNFFLDTQGGHDHYETIRQLSDGGSPQEFSYTFDILQSEDIKHNGNSGRRLIALKVIGIAPVTRGAGLNTRLLSLKGADGTWPSMSNLNPTDTRSLISKMALPQAGELRKALDDLCSTIQFKELETLKARLKESGGPALVDFWRMRLKQEGHSDPWIEAIIESEIVGLEKQLLDQNPMLEYQPGAAHALALRILNRPVGQGLDYYPEVGSSVRSPLFFI